LNNDGKLHYQSDGNGYLLYSVGWNGRDDGGFNQEHIPDSATEEQKNAWPKPWDDISIRVPPKKPATKP